MIPSRFISCEARAPALDAGRRSGAVITAPPAILHCAIQSGDDGVLVARSSEHDPGNSRLRLAGGTSG